MSSPNNQRQRPPQGLQKLYEHLCANQIQIFTTPNQMKIARNKDIAIFLRKSNLWKLSIINDLTSACTMFAASFDDVNRQHILTQHTGFRLIKIYNKTLYKHLWNNKNDVLKLSVVLREWNINNDNDEKKGIQ